jgi:hypothetical protein
MEEVVEVRLECCVARLCVEPDRCRGVVSVLVDVPALAVAAFERSDCDFELRFAIMREDR